MNLYDAFQKLTAGELAGWALAVLIMLFSLIQISPLKLNPWDKILGWFGRKLNGKTWINHHRQCILTFARECRAEIQHSSDEWTNVLNVAEEYEKYVTENKITNGIITQDTEYLRNLYQELSRDHRI